MGAALLRPGWRFPDVDVLQVGEGGGGGVGHEPEAVRAPGGRDQDREAAESRKGDGNETGEKGEEEKKG